MNMFSLPSQLFTNPPDVPDWTWGVDVMFNDLARVISYTEGNSTELSQEGNN